MISLFLSICSQRLKKMSGFEPLNDQKKAIYNMMLLEKSYADLFHFKIVQEILISCLSVCNNFIKFDNIRRDEWKDIVFLKYECISIGWDEFKTKAGSCFVYLCGYVQLYFKLPSTLRTYTVTM